MKRFFVPSSLFFVGLGIGTLIILFIFLQFSTKDFCGFEYRFLDADVNCAEEEEDATRIKSMEESVKAYIDAAQKTHKAERIGVFYRDLDSRKWFGVNELEPFTPASLLKIPLVIAYYKLAEVDPSILSRSLIYQHHPEIGPPFAAHLEDGRAYSVETLIEQVLLHSDNNATVALSNNLVGNYERKVFYDLGVTAPDQNVDYLSPKTYGAIFRALYNASYLQSLYSETMLEVMSRASFKEGLVGGVPRGVPVAHKFGYRINPDGSSELHDCGIVYHSKKPFILCVMTEGNDPNVLKEVIADITRIVWDIL